MDLRIKYYQSGVCKKHKTKRKYVAGHLFGRTFDEHYECEICVDNLDFWLPMPIYIVGIGGMIYYSIFPIILLFLFFTQGSTWRVLKRLLKKFKSQGF